MAKNKLIKPDEVVVGVYVLDALAVKRTVRVRVLVEPNPHVAEKRSK